MKKDSLWSIKGKEISEEELIKGIKEGLYHKEDMIMNRELLEEIAIYKTIYAFYLPALEEKDL